MQLMYCSSILPRKVSVSGDESGVAVDGRNGRVMNPLNRNQFQFATHGDGLGAGNRGRSCRGSRHVSLCRLRDWESEGWSYRHNGVESFLPPSSTVG